jgi:peptidoglycan/LPS O-acetylase OafA/YrhL
MTRRIPELDGLRAIAVTMVVLWHYVGIPGGDPLHTLFRPGRSGVDLFFVLSGFLITAILIESRGSQGYFRDFYTRRAFRILPVYLVMLALLIVGRHTNWNPAVFGCDYATWVYALFVQNFEAVRLKSYGAPWMAITWSLAIEEQFYLLFPLLVAFADPKRLPRYLAAILIAAPLLRIASAPLNSWAYYVLMPCRADSLAAGALIAWALSDAQAATWLRQRQESVRRLALHLLSLAPLLWLIPNRHLAVHMILWGHTYLTAMFATVLLAVLLHAGHPGLWPLRTRIGAGIAAISYAVYLVHPAALAAVAADSKATLDDVPLALVITLAACVASYFLIERPALRLGRTLTSPERQRPTSETVERGARPG